MSEEDNKINTEKEWWEDDEDQKKEDTLEHVFEDDLDFRQVGQELIKTRGRNFKPTQKQKELVAFMSIVGGISKNDMAKMLGVSYTTLEKHFGNNIRLAQSKANAIVVKSLFEKIKEGNVNAMIFWLKSKSGWREADRLEITVKDGADLMNPIERSQRIVQLLKKNPRVAELLSKNISGSNETKH